MSAVPPIRKPGVAGTWTKRAALRSLQVIGGLAAAPAIIAGGIVAGGGALIGGIAGGISGLAPGRSVMKSAKEWGLSAGEYLLRPTTAIVGSVVTANQANEQDEIMNMTWENTRGHGLRRTRIDVQAREPRTGLTGYYDRLRTHADPYHIRPKKAVNDQLAIAKAITVKAMNWNQQTPEHYRQLFAGYFTKQNPTTQLIEVRKDPAYGIRKLDFLPADLDAEEQDLQKGWQEFSEQFDKDNAANEQALGEFLQSLEDNIAKLEPDAAIRLLQEQQGIYTKKLEAAHQAEKEFLKTKITNLLILQGRRPDEALNPEQQNKLVEDRIKRIHQREKEVLEAQFAAIKNLGVLSQNMRGRALNARLLSIEDPKRIKEARAKPIDKLSVRIGFDDNPELLDFDSFNTELGNEVTVKKGPDGKPTGELEMGIAAHLSDYEADADCGDLVAAVACARPPHKSIELTCSTERVAKMLYRNARLHGFDPSQIKITNPQDGKPFDLDPIFKEGVELLVKRRDAIEASHSTPEAVSKSCAAFKEHLHAHPIDLTRSASLSI